MIKLLYFLFYILFFLPPAVAQNIICTELSEETDALPTNDISCIYQDSEGYMWYGTEREGLFRDDGYTVRTFHDNTNILNLPESNHITCIAEDNLQRIWFGTKRGAYILDKKNYRISPLADENIKSKVVNTIYASTDSSVWINVSNQLFRYNLQKERIGTYPLEWNGSPQTACRLYEYSGNIWMTQWKGGLLKYDTAKDCFIPHYWPFQDNPTCLLKDKYSPYYWIATRNKGIIRFNPSESNLRQMFMLQDSNYAQEEDIPRPIVNIVQDSTRHYLWASTPNNLYAYKITENSTLKQIDAISTSLPREKKIIHSITSDRTGNVWVASYYPRSFIISFPDDKISNHISPQIQKKLGMPTVPVKLIYEKGLYWFWQKSMDLCCYHIRNNDIATYKNGNLLVFMEKARYKEGIFTIQNKNTVVLIQYKNNKFEKQTICTLPLPAHEHIRTLHEDAFQNLWIGTSNTLFCYNPIFGELHQMWGNTGIINEIASSKEGYVYIGTETKGFLILSPQGEKQQYNEPMNCLYIAVSPRKDVWVTTPQGDVYCYNPTEKSFVCQTADFGLSGNVIYDIEADAQGRIWIVTDRKIIIGNSQKHTFDIIRSSTPSIPLENFLTIYKDDENNMHIGGTGGIITHVANQLPTSISAQNIVIGLTAVTRNGISQITDFADKKIIIQPEEQNIKLFFSTFDRLNAKKTRYAFRYKKSNLSWNYLPEKQNYIQLNKFPKGTHELEVKATDKNGLWSNNYITVTIISLPIWYETWWAYTIYIAIFLIVMILIIKIGRRTKQHTQLLQVSGHTKILENTKSLKLIDSPNAPETHEIIANDREEPEVININRTIISPSDEQLIKKVTDLIEKNISNSNYSIEELSKNIGMSRVNLYRKINSITGITPTEFVKDIRLRQAAELLKQGNLTVAEIAYSVGFNTPGYFTQSFKKKFGVLPTQYK